MDNVGAPPPMFTSTNFVVPLLVSLSGVVCAAMAVFLYHFFLVKYCRERRRRRRRARLALEVLDAHRRMVAGGLDPELLKSVPVVSYSLARIRDDVMDQRECVVCIGELEEGDMVRLLPDCRHAFHVSCIDRWFAAHSTCPVCRSRVDPETPGGTGTQNGIVAGSNNNDNDNQAATVDAVVASSSSSSTSSSFGAAVEMHSCGLIRHCASLVMLPAERRSSPRGMKRSLSMDLSFVIDMPPSVSERLTRSGSIHHQLDKFVSSSFLEAS